MLFKTPNPSPASPPRSLQDVPAFAEAERRWLDLCAQQSANSDELRRLYQELRAVDERRSVVRAGAEAVVEALADGASWEAAQTMGNATPLEEQIGELRQRESVLQKAIDLADRRLREVRREASAAVYGERRAEHARLVRTMASALIVFCWGMKTERDFRNALESEGLLGIPAPSSYAFDELGEPDGRGGGAAARYLQELEACGFITSAEFAGALKGEPLTP
jgi:hypothetical protein